MSKPCPCDDFPVSDETNSLPALPPKPVRLLQYLWYDLHHALPSGRRRHSPIFIVGCGHSGTSLMLRMLGAHSNIHAIADETGVAIGEDDAIFRLYARNFDKSAAMAGKMRWVEKTPKHVQHIEFIRRHRPESKFIGIVRDPRDVANSLKKRHGDLQAGIDRWIEDDEALISFAGASFMRIIRYEDLVDDAEGLLRGCMEFLGEPYEESQLAFHRRPVDWYVPAQGPVAESSAPEEHNALRNWQINQPVFDGRRKWEKELTASEVDQVVVRTADLAARFGYDLRA